MARKKACVVGEKIGGITVMSDAGLSPPHGKRKLRGRLVWAECYCKVGFRTYLAHLRSGLTKSCGCLKLSLKPPLLRRSQSAIDDVLARTKFINGSPCMPWPGALSKAGYGDFPNTTPNGPRHLPAHRMVYENVVGPVPDGKILDHLCSNKSCVNPAHLEPVTVGENVRREFDRRESCRKGHKYVSGSHEEGSYVDSRSGKTYRRRVCLVCLEQYELKRKSRRG